MVSIDKVTFVLMATEIVRLATELAEVESGVPNDAESPYYSATWLRCTTTITRDGEFVFRVALPHWQSSTYDEWYVAAGEGSSAEEAFNAAMVSVVQALDAARTRAAGNPVPTEEGPRGWTSVETDCPA